MGASYTFGIEEEYFVFDTGTRDVPPRMPEGFLEACSGALGERVSSELLQSQIETSTPVCDSTGQAREALARQRRTLAAIASSRGLGLLACSTHPLAEWRAQRHTDQPRYAGLVEDLQMLALRNLLCGLHVHVELPDPDRRVELMNRMLPFVPVLLALSTSSPFWRGRRTGLMGYRLAAYAELPRTGLPRLFATKGEYERYVDILTQAGAVPDASYVWWAIRPSHSFPTLELRVPDACTDLEDALCLAALYRCLVRRLFVDPSINADIDAVTRAIADENLWRAQRYGVSGELIDAGQRRLVPLADCVEQLLALTGPDASALGCESETARARVIVARGTSADRQVAVYRRARHRGAAHARALVEVVDDLAQVTLRGMPEGWKRQNRPTRH